MKKTVYVEHIAAMLPEQAVRDCFLVKGPRVGTSRNGEPYLTLTLVDRTGAITARKWSVTPEDGQLHDGAAVWVQGKVNLFNNQRQVVIDELRPLSRADGVDLRELMPAPLESHLDLDGLYREVVAAVEAVRVAPLRELLGRLLVADPEIAARFRRAPAAIGYHHNYVGGLMEHCLSLVRLARAVAPLYPECQEDLLVAVCLLHDLGKIYEYEYETSLAFATEGSLRGHIQIAHAMVERAAADIPDFPPELRLNLLHCILSHHGQAEWGSPVPPRTLEAHIFHALDLLDGRAAPVCQKLRDAYRTGAGEWADRDTYVGDAKWRFEGYPSPQERRLQEILTAFAGRRPTLRVSDRAGLDPDRLDVSEGAREYLRQRLGRLDWVLFDVSTPLVVVDCLPAGGQPSEENRLKEEIARSAGLLYLGLGEDEFNPLSPGEAPTLAEVALTLAVGERAEDLLQIASLEERLARELGAPGLTWEPEEPVARQRSLFGQVVAEATAALTLPNGRRVRQAAAVRALDVPGWDLARIAAQVARYRCLVAAMARKSA